MRIGLGGIITASTRPHAPLPRAGRPSGRRFGELVHACLATVPLDAIAYRFDIVLRGRRSTLFENRLEGN